MIRAIITDVDGVIIGHTPNVNFPLPHTQVLEAFKKVREDNIPIVLCTAKSLYPIEPIIQQAHLENPHISDGGSLISNPIGRKLVAKHMLPKDVAEKFVYYALKNDIYIEVHTEENYFIQQDEKGIFARQHAEVEQREPIRVTSLLEIIGKEDIIKIILIVENEEAKELVTPQLEALHHDMTAIWTIHPSMLPAQFAVITAYGASKKHAAEEVIETLGISFDEVLGIGDTKGDWQFMQLCRYVAIVGDESLELKELAKTKGEGKYFFAPSVEENGILQVFDYFKI